MAVRTTLNVSLTPELEQFVQDRVASGRYQTASEVVRDGLRLLESQEQDKATRFRALKSRLEEAVAAAKRGELVDPQVVLDDIAELKRKRATRKN